MIKTFTPNAKKYFLLIFFLASISVFKANAAAPPVITSFSPASGAVGTSVTITGSGFNTTATSNIVFFGATIASVTSASATSLTVTVPTGASYQPISVLNGTTQLTGYSTKPFIVTFTGKHSITASDFATQVNFTTGTLPVNIATGDLDGDGKPDLVVVNNTGNTISIFRNTSTNGSISSTSFATKVDITTGSIPYYVAIADLDGDGKPEIAVCNNVSNTVSVFYNKSVSGTLTTASFSGKVDFAVGTAPRSLAIGDIDGDGKADLVVTNTTTNNVSVLLNTTTTGSITAASFAAAVNFATGAGPRGLAIGDIDGDGKPDLAIADFGASTISVLRNTSTPGSITASSFAATVDITCGLHPYVVALGDIDGDGKLDMVVANQGASTMSVLRNTATSGAITTTSFAATVDIVTPSTPTGVAIADLDGDGKPDVVITNQGNASVSAFRNTATSGAISASSFAAKVTYTVGSTPYNSVIEDIDGDGIPDIISANNGANNISVLHNIPTPVTQATNVTFSATTATTTTVSWTSGSGVSRAVFILAGNTGTPSPVNLTTYTSNAAYGSGTQIGTSGWYCVYNGTAATVNVTNLTAGVNYRVMSVEYNGTAGNELYQTATGTNDPVNLYNPIISTTGTLSAMSTTYGTTSSSNTFSVSGSGMAAGILVTAPSGFEVSTDNTTFTSTVTVGALGTIASTSVYIRLAASAVANSYSGNVVLSSSGATSVSVVTVSSTVSKAALSITADNQTKAYGAALPTLTASYSGFVNGDTQSSLSTQATIATTAVASSSVAGAPYPITVNGAASSNYTITYVAGALTVTQVPLTITATGASKTYGSANPTLVVTYNGFVGTDDATSLSAQPVVSTTALTGSSAGSYAISVSGAVSPNYTISYVAATLTVNTVALTITADNQTKAYGAVLPTLTASYSGFVNGDTQASLVTQPTLSTTAAASSPASGSTYPITASGAVSSNYTISYVDGALSVNPAALTITATSASKTYGSANPTLVVTYSGFAGADDATSLSTQPVISTTALTGSAAGSYPINISGAASSNYTISYVSGTLTINPATLTITADNQTKAFGAALPALTASYSGFVNGDTQANLAAQPTLSTTATATSAITGSPYAITVNGAASPNYTISYVAGILTVTQAILTITATNANKTYGSANPALTVSYSGFAGSDNINSLSTLPTISTAAITGSPVGNYAITASGAVLANYTINYVNGILAINPATLTITANDVSKLPATTLTGGAGSSAFIATGLASGETVGSVTITYGSGAAAGDAQGVYTGQVTPSLLTGGNFMASNYNITYVKGNIVVGTSTITKSGTLSALTTTFGTASGNSTFNVSGSNLSNNITVTAPAGFEVSVLSASGFANSLTLTPTTGTISNTPIFVRLSATAAAGNYSGDVILTSTGAATVNVATVSSTVSPAALTLTANNVTKTYGQAITGGAGSTAFVAGSGLKNGNTISSVTLVYGTGSAAIATANTYSGSVVPSLAVGANGFLASNYTITYTAGNIIVNPAVLTITATNASKTYGSVNPALAVTYNGFAGSDNAASLTTQPTITTTAVTTSVVGTYPVTANGATSPNYTISYVVGNLIVTPGALTVTATSATKTYGSVNPTLAVSYSGFVGTDNVASLTTQPSITTTAVTGSPVATYPITASGAASSNYTISYVAGTLTVNPATLTVTATNASKTYGTANPVLAVGYSGFVGTDNAASLSSQPSVNTTAVALSPVGVYPITASGAASTNYSINYSTGTLTVSPAALAISATNAAKTYGAPNPVLTATYNGFVGTDNAASLSTQPTISTTVITTSTVGTYPIAVSGAASANYTISYVAGTLTVNKATLTITATNASKIYGSANPALAITYNGFAGADNAASLSAQSAISTTALTTSPAGTYPITVSGATAANYTINNVNGTLTVTPATLTVMADNQTKTLGQANPVLTVTYTGFVNGDAPASLTTLPVVSTTATVSSPIGTYPITASGAAAANYAVNYVPGTLTVNAQANANLSNLTVNNGTLSPVFVQGTTTYSIAVGNGITSINVTPTTVDANATVKVNGSNVVSGTASASVPLVVGANIITTVVTAQDGFTKITYTINVTRAASANASLSFLAISDGALSPIFAPTITAYTAGIANTVSSISITPTLADPTATLTVNGATASNGSAVTIGGLATGDNNVTIVVTAQDGVTKTTYTLIIYKAAPPETITATNILSPNGDGKNDNWAIKDILLYPNNTVTVYDRGGRIVFSKKSYTNDWAGTINGSPLAEDTYYYSVDLGVPSAKPITGFITIVRSRK